jgi:hypothetical protein
LSISLVWDMITGAGVAGAVLVLMITGVLFTRGYVEDQKERYEEQLRNRDAQIAEKNEAIRIERDRADAERRRADVAVEAAQTTNVMLAAITGGRREIGAS